jgi:hypothetical protein
MTPWLTRVLLGLLSLGGLAAAGDSITHVHHRADARAQLADAREISVVLHQTDLLFVTTSGSASPYPTGPLVPGDRVLGRDDIEQNGSDIGSDYEVCTASFGLNVLCDDMVNITNNGQLHVTWSFQWPASGTTGPPNWSGVVDGGTGIYQNAIGSFQAQLLPDHDVNITMHIVRPDMS